MRDAPDTLRGRCYFILRPSSELAREIVEQSPTAAEAEALRAPVVLIVEDEFSVRWPAAEYLREISYSVIEASNANDAITVLTSGAPIDLAFVDFKLPGSQRPDARQMARRTSPDHAGAAYIGLGGDAAGVLQRQHPSLHTQAIHLS